MPKAIGVCCVQTCNYNELKRRRFSVKPVVVVYDANGALENPITQNDEIKEYVDCR